MDSDQSRSKEQLLSDVKRVLDRELTVSPEGVTAQGSVGSQTVGDTSQAGATAGEVPGKTQVFLTTGLPFVDELNKPKIRKLKEALRIKGSTGAAIQYANQFDRNLVWPLIPKTLRRGGQTPEEADQWAERLQSGQLSFDQFCHTLEQGLGSARGKNTNVDAVQREVQELKVDCYLLSEDNGAAAVETALTRIIWTKLNTSVQAFEAEEAPPEWKNCVNAILHRWRDPETGLAAAGTYPLMEGLVRTRMARQAEVVSTLSGYLDIVYQVIDELMEPCKVAALAGLGEVASSNRNDKSSIKRKQEYQSSKEEYSKKIKSDKDGDKNIIQYPKCKGCNKRHPNDGECRYQAHPDYNNSNLPFEKTGKGKKYVELMGINAQLRRFWRLRADQSRLEKFEGVALPEGVGQNNSVKKKNSDSKVKVSSVCATVEHTDYDNTDNECIVLCRINGKILRVLLDLGAGSNNYMTPETVEVLKMNSSSNYKNDYYVDECECKSVKICSALNKCVINNKCGKIKINIYSNLNKKNIDINFSARIVKGLPYDFIIGLPTIKKFKLTEVFKELFVSYNEEGTEISSKSNEEKDITHDMLKEWFKRKEEKVIDSATNYGNSAFALDNTSTVDLLCALNLGIGSVTELINLIKSKSDLLGEMEIEDDGLDMLFGDNNPYDDIIYKDLNTKNIY